MTMTQKPCPSSICFRVTRRCNAACSFCQAPNTSRTELTVDQIRILSGIFASAGVLSIKLSGGEPTVWPDLPDMTNDDVLRVRSFERIMRNLDSCRQRNIPFALNTVVTSQTMKLMDDMVRFALAQGARKISFIPVLPRGRAATSGQDGLDTNDLSLVRARMATFGRYGDRIKVSCIDIRLRDYWVVENDGSLWIERSTEGLDVRVCGYDDLLRQSSLLVKISP